jgi:hypothetical protein
MNILIETDGSIRTVYTEAIPLHELGVLEVKRFGHVEFDREIQEWTVRLVSDPGRIAFSHPLRSQAMAWEHIRAEESLCEPSDG